MHVQLPDIQNLSRNIFHNIIILNYYCVSLSICIFIKYIGLDLDNMGYGKLSKCFTYPNVKGLLSLNISQLKRFLHISVCLCDFFLYLVSSRQKQWYNHRIIFSEAPCSFQQSSSFCYIKHTWDYTKINSRISSWACALQEYEYIIPRKILHIVL